MAKQSTLKTAYQKERARIQRKTSDLMKRGYITPDILPKIPKRITQGSINKLKKITNEKILSESYYISGDTAFKGKRGQEIEREERRKAKQQISTTTPPAEDVYQQVINNFLHDILSSMVNPGHNVFVNFIENLINQKGIAAVAQMIINALSNGYEIQPWMGYRENDFNAKMKELLSYFSASAVDLNKVMSAVEQSEGWD